MYLDLLKRKCDCGCGQLMPSVDSRLRPRTYLRGHGRSKSLPVDVSHEHNPVWKGGRKSSRSRGYIYVKVDAEHHLADGDGYAAEHRLICEEKLGRRLRADEVVHHINGNVRDNRPENLEALPIEQHVRQHARTLTDSTVITIRETCRSSSATYEAIGKMYGISECGVQRIATGARYVEVGGPLTFRCYKTLRKLSRQDAQRLWMAYHREGASVKHLAREQGVSIGAVRSLVIGETYKDATANLPVLRPVRRRTMRG